MKITFAAYLEGHPVEISEERRKLAGYLSAIHQMNQEKHKNKRISIKIKKRIDIKRSIKIKISIMIKKSIKIKINIKIKRNIMIKRSININSNIRINIMIKRNIAGLTVR